METRFKQNMLLGTLALSTFLVSAGTSMASLALPLISAEFSLSFSKVRWVVLCYLLAITLFSLIVGRFGDLKGRRNILLLGTAMFSTGTLVSSLSFSFPALISGRIIQGIGAAALAVLPIAIVTDAFPSNKMGRAIGWLATMSALGTATGPSLGGFLLREFDWRSAFTVMTILGVFAFLFSFRFVPLSEGSSNSVPQNNNFLHSIKSFYSDASLGVHLFSNLTISAVMISTLIVGPFYLTHVLHLDPGNMGLVMSVGPITSILSGTLAGYAIDRFGCHVVIKFGFAQSLIGTLSFVFLPMQLGPLGFVISAVVLSLGYQLFLSANSNSFMKNALTEHRGMAAGALNLSRNLGLIIGTYVTGSIFDLFAKGSTSSYGEAKAISNGFQVTFSIAAVLIAVLLINQLKHEKRRICGKRFAN